MLEQISNRFSLKPPYRTYLSPTYPLSILAAVADLEPILASYYINVQSFKPEDAIHRNWGFGMAITPWLDVTHFAALGYFSVEEYDIISSKGDSYLMLEWMMKHIEAKAYLYCHVDEFYVDGTRSSGKCDFLHPCMVIGCDKKHELFEVATYLHATGHYGISRVPFKRMIEAIVFRPLKRQEVFKFNEFRLLAVALPSPKAFSKLDIKSTYIQLSNYLSSRGTGDLSQDELVYKMDGGSWSKRKQSSKNLFGLEAITACLTYFETAVMESRHIDSRDTRVILEQKEILRVNISYLTTTGIIKLTDELINLIESVVEWARMLHILGVAYNRDRSRRDAFLRVANRSAETILIENRVLQPALECIAGHLEQDAQA